MEQMGKGRQARDMGGAGRGQGSEGRLLAEVAQGSLLSGTPTALTPARVPRAGWRIKAEGGEGRAKAPGLGQGS